MWCTWERTEKRTRSWRESLKEREHSEDQGVGVIMGSERMLGRLSGGGVEWVQLAQDRGWWWAVVNVVMNPKVLAPQS
jgi:hypothetical protein